MSSSQAEWHFEEQSGLLLPPQKINPLRVHSVSAVDNGEFEYREALCNRGDRDKNGFHELSSRADLMKSSKRVLSLSREYAATRRARIAWPRYRAKVLHYQGGINLNIAILWYVNENRRGQGAIFFDSDSFRRLFSLLSSLPASPSSSIHYFLLSAVWPIPSSVSLAPSLFHLSITFSFIPPVGIPRA